MQGTKEKSLSLENIAAGARELHGGGDLDVDNVTEEGTWPLVGGGEVPTMVEAAQRLGLCVYNNDHVSLPKITNTERELHG